MNPGRELDALIAEKVMGWKHEKVDGFSFFTSPDGKWDEPEPHPYSTDIASSWYVVNSGVFEYFSIGNNYTIFKRQFAKNKRKVWSIEFRAARKHARINWVEGKTAPHAICLAALKAVGFEI